MEKDEEDNPGGGSGREEEEEEVNIITYSTKVCSVGDLHVRLTNVI